MKLRLRCHSAKLLTPPWVQADVGRLLAEQGSAWCTAGPAKA